MDIIKLLLFWYRVSKCRSVDHNACFEVIIREQVNP